MFYRTLATLCAWMLILSGFARADGTEYAVNISDGPLQSGLKTLESQTGIELLYDGDVVREFSAPPVVGKLTTEDALEQLLSETELTVRRASSGAWIIERSATAPLAQQDAAVAEILVVGRRTQNADIRRYEDDVQPYTIATQAEIRRAHRDNINQYFANRVTSNTQWLPSDWSQDADTLSAIDLRGLGSDATLVLVDGRRMPAVPITGTGFRQADVNAIPLHAVERIEVLTGSAGGIHGFGALGGVVNVVLDRESRGLELHAFGGISARDDAGRKGVEANFGHTSTSGRTDFTATGSYSESDPLLVGQRGYSVRDRRRTSELLPGSYLFGYPVGNSVSVASLNGLLGLEPNLTLKPEYGGARLPSDRTFLPAGFSGGATELAAVLTQNAGETDFSLPDGDNGSDLGSNPRSHALLMNLRHRFGETFEAYADAMVLGSRGDVTDQTTGDLLQLANGQAILAPESPANPFVDYISVSFPIPDTGTFVEREYDISRYVAGLEAALPFDWRGTIEASDGSLRYSSFARSHAFVLGFLTLVGDPSDPDINPLGNWDEFQEAIAINSYASTSHVTYRSRFRTQSLRLAGAVFSTAQGPATLTLLAERRSDRVPTTTEFRSTEQGGITTETTVPQAARSSRATSFYAELRSRVLPKVELQLAVRHDDQKDVFAKNFFGADNGGFQHERFVATAYTAGAKFTPWSWLMLRGSYATGEQPPLLVLLRESADQVTTMTYYEDPKRGNTGLGEDGPFVYKSGGNPALKNVRANTLSLGTVVTPFGADGPRFAVDYSRIRKHREYLPLSAIDIVEHEDYWPERLTRAPLSDADRALGYTGGPVTMIDARYMNGAGVTVDAFDARVEWPLPLFDGRLNLYADASYHKRNTKKALFEPDYERAGYWEGPLRRRANGGVDWSRGRLSLGANLQYFGRYFIVEQGPRALLSEARVQAQGSTWIPSQKYLDLHASWKVRDAGALRDLTLELGFLNALDTEPPRVSSYSTTGPGYSLFGDPRLRRFELGVSCHF